MEEKDDRTQVDPVNSVDDAEDSGDDLVLVAKRPTTADTQEQAGDDSSEELEIVSRRPAISEVSTTSSADDGASESAPDNIDSSSRADDGTWLHDKFDEEQKGESDPAAKKARKNRKGGSGRKRGPRGDRESSSSPAARKSGKPVWKEVRKDDNTAQSNDEATPEAPPPSKSKAKKAKKARKAKQYLDTTPDEPEVVDTREHRGRGRGRGGRGRGTRGDHRGKSRGSSDRPRRGGDASTRGTTRGDHRGSRGTRGGKRGRGGRGGHSEGGRGGNGSVQRYSSMVEMNQTADFLFTPSPHVLQGYYPTAMDYSMGVPNPYYHDGLFYPPDSYNYGAYPGYPGPDYGAPYIPPQNGPSDDSSKSEPTGE